MNMEDEKKEYFYVIWESHSDNDIPILKFPILNLGTYINKNLAIAELLRLYSIDIHDNSSSYGEITYVSIKQMFFHTVKYNNKIFIREYEL